MALSDDTRSEENGQHFGDITAEFSTTYGCCGGVQTVEDFDGESLLTDQVRL
jgi:hypothetical protein